MAAQVTQRAAGARIDSLDVLRGFAILGILVMNIQMFSMVNVAYMNPTLAGPMQGPDYWIWLVSHIAFENKFLAIFAALFGAGIVLMAERAELAGDRAAYRHMRRMGVLALIGGAHAYLIWHGDILLVYAVMGMIAFAFRHLPIGKLMAVAACLYLVPLLISIVLTIVFFNLPDAYYKLLETQYWQPVSPTFTLVEAAYRGDWMQQMQARFHDASTFHIWLLPLKHGWHVLALMLAGMAAYRSGLLTGAWSNRAYAWTALLGLVVGLPLVLAGVWFNQATGWEMATSLFLGAEFNHIAAPFIATAWICGMILLLRSGWLARVIDALRNVGRTALSCYLLTSVVCTSIFYGYGLGLFGQLGRSEQLAVVLFVWVILVGFASLWLQFFRMGPMEWLWRWGASGRRARMLRSERIPPSGAGPA